MTHDAAQVCLCVAEHRPPYLELHAHHVWPLFMQGPDEPDNIVWICPNAHASTHELLRLMVELGPLTYRACQDMEPRPVSRYAYDLARDGHARWAAATL